MPFIIASFYHFFDFSHFARSQAPLLALMKANDIRGSILIAEEGFNGTISGKRKAVDAVLAHLAELAGGPFEHKESTDSKHAFPRTKVRLKKATISLGEPAPLELVGEYVAPKEWNALISDPHTIVLDTRNRYETHLGTFKGAIDPDTQNFKELPAFVRKNLGDAKQKKIATYCTGGIRCEKFTAWMKAEGFEKVYHLKGGILKYLEEIPKEESTWEGECYVFDKRIALGHGLVPTTTMTQCNACGNPQTEEDRKSPHYIEHVQCVFCVDEKSLSA